MINIKKAYEEFEKYIEQFNPNEGRIRLKIDHIKRVAKLSREIAQKLGLNENQINLAEIIGIFHDIGRFKQAQIYNTFNDKISMNHAELSVKVLFEDNLIEKFEVEEKYRSIIKLAILNHNKSKIEDGLNDEEMLFAKIIRDADKLDIYYTICEYDFPSIFWYSDFNCEEISDTIMNEFLNDKTINYGDIKTNADQIPTFFAYIYDLYFDFSIKYLREKKYLDKITQKVYENFESETIKKQVKNILDISNEFLEIN